MTKRNKFYQIGFIVSTIVCIGLMLAMGIIAVQKSMKLNLSFQTNPKVYCQLMIGSDVVFDNTNPTSSTIGNYITLSGNTLTFDKGKFETSFGTGSFDLKITNGSNTQSAILVEIANVANETCSIISVSGSQTFSITPTSTLMTISMTKVLPVEITKTGAVLSGGNIETTTNGDYYLNIEEYSELNASFTAQTPTYKDPVSITATTSKGEYSASGSITIPSQNLGTTNISINAIAQSGSATITYGTMTNCTSSETATSVAIGSTYTTNLTATNGNIFDNVTVSGSPYTWTPNATDKRLGTLTVNVTGNFIINTSVRKPTLSITYTGDLVNGKQIFGLTVELVLGDDYWISMGGMSGILCDYTANDSNTSAVVSVGESVLLYCAEYDVKEETFEQAYGNLNSEPGAFNVGFYFCRLDLSISSSSPTITEAKHPDDYGATFNNLYFQMPACDVIMTVDTTFAYAY